MRQAAKEDRQEEFEIKKEREEFQRKQKLFEKQIRKGMPAEKIEETSNCNSEFIKTKEEEIEVVECPGVDGRRK